MIDYNCNNLPSHVNLQKSLTIFGSALYGGAIVATCLDYFLEGSVMLLWVWDKVRVKRSPQPCWFSWVVLGVWPTLVALGKSDFLNGRLIVCYL